VQECHLEPSPGPSTCISSQAILLVFVNCIIENLALQDKKKAVKSMVRQACKNMRQPDFPLVFEHRHDLISCSHG
jgi:hypothetical protein